MNCRQLTGDEIKRLEKQGNSAEGWDSVLVREGFVPDCIHHVHFSGEVRLGCFRGSLMIDEGVRKLCGLYRTYIQDCTIGDDVYIADVKNLIRYDIASHVVIDNVASLSVSGETFFGNGTEVEVINESGGREILISDRMTAQIAYLLATCRNDGAFIDKLKTLIEGYVETKRASKGYIGKGSRILNAGKIRNVAIGESSIISGVLLLEEGTIASNVHDSIYVGEGAVAKQFIMLSGSRIDGAAMVDRCFIGQGVRIGKQFSAENCCFFANSEGFHGEACNIFAGPFMVTHHKSTLLIAGLFSFFSAGSGSNQSNHMYKLGALHQGILERGVKTGSFSYMMWPCRVGAFTGVIGRHSTHFDTTDLPFSYILESQGKSILSPAMNLLSIGPRRDKWKWLNRDRRKDTEKYDLIHFDLFSPYTMGKIILGIDLLKQLDEKTPRDQKVVNRNGVLIRRVKLRTGWEHYQSALELYIGDVFVARLKKVSDVSSMDKLLAKLYIERSEALGAWVDLSGMYAPKSLIDGVIESVRSNAISSLDDLIRELKNIYLDYEELAWVWCVDLIQRRFGVEFQNLTKEHLIQIIMDWRSGVKKMNDYILKDAKKEFSEKSRIGYGIDGDENIRDEDFMAVHGEFEKNKFIAGIMEESDSVEKRAGDLIDYINHLS